MFKRLLSDSLVHFVALGALVFGFYHYNNAADAPITAHIVIDEQQIDDMTHAFSDANGRHPVAEELNGMIEQAVNQEVMLREGLKRGLDKDDDIIQKRVMMRMDFLLEAMVSAPEPSTEQLQAFLNDNISVFQEENRYSFSHVFFQKDQAGNEAALARASALLDQLNAEVADEQGINNAYKRGDAFPRSYNLWKATQTDINRLFGTAFGMALKNITQAGHWVGPLKSTYGWHLVFVKKIELAAAPTLAEHAAEIKAAWEKQQKMLAKQQWVSSTKQEYTVRIERHRDDEPEKSISQNTVSQNTVSLPE